SPGGQPELPREPAAAVLVLLRLRAEGGRLHLRRADREDGQARSLADASRAGGSPAQAAQPRAEGALRHPEASARDAQARRPILRVRPVEKSRGRTGPAI